MAKFGITAIGVVRQNNNTFIMKRSRKNRSKWTRNINAAVSPELKKLLNNIDHFAPIMKQLSRSGEIEIFEITHIYSNDELIPITNLYKGSAKQYCMFKKEDNGEKSLVCIDCRRAREIVALGYDSYNKSKVPLVFTVKDKNAIPTNVP